MSLRRFWDRYFALHHCCGCGELLSAEELDRAYCSSCALAWREALTVGCDKCLQPAFECRCMPKALSSSGALCLRKQFFYRSEESRSPEMSILYWLKYKHSRRVTNFVAGVVAESIRSELEDFGILTSKEHFVVCGVPRGKKARLKHGFDQSQDVARAIGKLLGIEYVYALRSVSGGSSQKDLDKSGRLRNANAHIRFWEKADVKGKYVILFDDMVTTGASMSVCVRLLRKHGAYGVACFSVACSSRM